MCVQHQGTGAGEGCAPSQVGREAEDSLWFKMSKTPNLHSFFYCYRPYCKIM